MGGVLDISVAFIWAKRSEITTKSLMPLPTSISCGADNVGKAPESGSDLVDCTSQDRSRGLLIRYSIFECREAIPGPAPYNVHT